MSPTPLARIAAAVALSLAAGIASAQFSNFYSFGDSLSDVGSFRPLPIFPPDAGTATTNPQPLWTSWLAQRYGLSSTPANQGGNNYAEVGARVAQNPGSPADFPPTAGATPVVTQIASFSRADRSPAASRSCRPAARATCSWSTCPTRANRPTACRRASPRRSARS